MNVDKIPILGAGGKLTGHVIGDIYYITTRTSDILAKPEALVIDATGLDHARAAGASQIRIHNQDTDIVYIASINTVILQGFPRSVGEGAQIGVALYCWHADKY